MNPRFFLIAGAGACPARFLACAGTGDNTGCARKFDGGFF